MLEGKKREKNIDIYFSGRFEEGCLSAITIFVLFFVFPTPRAT